MKKTLIITVLLLVAITATVLCGCSSDAYTYEYYETGTVEDGTNVISYQLAGCFDANKQMIGEKYAVVTSVEVKEEDGVVEIPQTVSYNGSEFAVKEIFEGAFIATGDLGAYVSNTKVKKVVLPEGLTKIANRAFYFCAEMTEIIIPSTIESVGDFSFFGCKKLAEINLHNVKEVGAYSFRECLALKKVVFTATERPMLGEHVFFYIDSNAPKDSQYKVLEDLVIYVPDVQSYSESVTSENPDFLGLKHWSNSYAGNLAVAE